MLIVCSCSRQEARQTYDNPEIGLRLTYPPAWKVMKKNWLDNAIKSAEKKSVISQENVDLAKSVAPMIVFTAAKPRKVDSTYRNSSINVVVIPVPEDEWKDVNLDSLIGEQIDDIKSGFPESEVATGAFPLPDYPAIHNYRTSLKVAGCTVTQYQYFYWRQPYLVQFAFSFSHPDDEQELKDIIKSTRIDDFPKPDAKNGQ